MNLRQRQRVQTRAAILRIAAEEFDARGYLGAAISDIAERLGQTKGSVYFHFPSKAQLAAEIVAGYFQMWEQVLQGVADQGLRGFGALRQISLQLAFRYRDDVSVRASVRLMRESDLIDAELPRPFVEWMSTVAAYLEEARDDGELREGVAIDQVAWHLVASFDGIQEVSHQLCQREDIEQRIEALWAFLLPGIAARKGPDDLSPRGRDGSTRDGSGR